MAQVFDVYKNDADTTPLDINDYLVKHPASTFFLPMEGDGPEGSEIQAGDVLVVDRSVSPAQGDLLVAAIEGELSVIFFDKDSEQTDITLWGVVIGLVRKF